MHIHIGPDISVDSPNTGIFLTIILALTTMVSGGMSFLQDIDLVAGVILKFVGIAAGASTIIAAYWTVKASKKRLSE